MAGMSDYSAQAFLNWAGGNQAMPALASRYLALFTTAPTSDAGTGGTEVSGGSYARVQISGAITAGGTISTGSPNITMGSSNPGWVVAGMNVYDTTVGFNLGTVSSYIGTALVLTGNAAHAGSGSTDSLVFSAFPLASASSGSEPATTPANITSQAAISFVQSTASWGTVVAIGVYDASTSGNLVWWDYLGNYKWSPFSCTSASPGVLTCTDQTFVNGQYAAVTAKFGGTLPTTGGSWSGILTVAGVSGSTFNLGVNTTGTGDGLVRQVIQQSIPINTVATFSSGNLILTGA